MKIRSFLFSLMMFSSLGFAVEVQKKFESPIEGVSDEIQFVDVHEIDEDTLLAVFESKYPNIAIRFTEKMQLPLSFSLKGDFLNYQSSEAIGHVEVKQTFYQRCVNGNFLFSLDGRTWKPFFEFSQGNISVGISKDETRTGLFIDGDLLKRE